MKNAVEDVLRFPYIAAMKISPPFLKAQFIRRYKRFFADVLTESGEMVTLHCPNTGSMKNCLVEYSPCWYSLSNNPKRKLPGTLELVTTSHGHIAGVNTGRPNQLVREAIESGKITALSDNDELLSEVRYGEEKSRIDLLLNSLQGQCYIEVKNVTLDMGGGLAMFPDAVTSRGAKHLRELMGMVAQGHRAVLFFCVQLSGVDRVTVAEEIDPNYAQTLRNAIAAGVEVMAWQAELSADEIVLTRPLEVFVPD